MAQLPTIAICVGHSRRLATGQPEGGAWTHDGATSEWRFWHGVAPMVSRALRSGHGLRAVIVDDYGARGYTEAMRWLGGELRALGSIRLAVELHFNAASATANGHEWLHWPGSANGRRLATQMHLAMGEAFPGIRARGVKTPIAGRGDGFLRWTPCPAVIAEPFFGSNRADWRHVGWQQERLAGALAAGLAAAHEQLFPAFGG
jgi:hypothetical protein